MNTPILVVLLTELVAVVVVKYVVEDSPKPTVEVVVLAVKMVGDFVNVAVVLNAVVDC